MLSHVVMMVVVASVTGDPNTSITIENAAVRLVAEVRVPTTAAGQLLELSVKEGDLVEPGQVVGQLDDDLQQLDKRLAELQHEIAVEKSNNDVDERYAKKSREVAQSELSLSLDAVKRVPTSVAQTELERLKLVVERSELAIEQAYRDLRVGRMAEQVKQLELSAAKLRLERRKIKAPLGGMVVETFVQPGEWLEPGKPIVRIIRLDRLRVEAYLKASEIGADVLGRAARLTVQLPMDDEADFDGTVTFVSPEVEPVTGEVRIWIEVENKGLKLRPGTRGRLTILPHSR